MVIQFLLDMIVALFVGIFNLIPALPAMPTEITGAGTWIVDQFEAVNGVIRMFYGDLMFTAVITCVVLLWQFENVYHLTMWVIRKLPISST